MAKSIMDQVQKAREAFKAEMGKMSDALKEEARGLRERLAEVETALDEIEGKTSKTRKASASGQTRTRQSPGKNEGKTLVEVVFEIIKANKGKASTTTIREAMEKAGDNRGVNLSALAAQGHVKKVGEEEKAEGAKGRAAGIYAIAKG